MLAFGAGIGSAAGSSASGGRRAKPAVTRDHGRGHWYERACDAPRPGVASCDAQVVAAADGTPARDGDAAGRGVRPCAVPLGLQPAHDRAERADGRDRRRLRRSQHRVGPRQLQRLLRPASVHHGERLLQEGEPDAAARSTRSRTRAGPSRSPSTSRRRTRSARTARSCSSRPTSATTANLYAAENEAVKLGATAISNSWLTGEYSNETADDVNFNHPGVAITASSGDNGYGVGYPAASRYVTAVGGTTLALGSGGSYGGESAWSGSGSGCSAYEPKPAWQTDTGCPRRSVADVSADADPNTGRGRLRHRFLLRSDGLVPGRRHEPLLAAHRLGLTR